MKMTTLQVYAVALVQLFIGQCIAQEESTSAKDKLSATIAVGYFTPFLTDEGIAFDNAVYDPQVGFGFSYSLSADYIFNEKFTLGAAFNGNHASGEFIRDATINGETVNGFLEAGAVPNTHILLNLGYIMPGENFQPFVKLGFGFFSLQVEQGDVPLALTNNVEVEMFPDYKYSGFGVLPQLGFRKDAFSLSVGYSAPFGKLTGEAVPGFNSPGTISSQGLQIDLGYRIFLL